MKITTPGVECPFVPVVFCTLFVCMNFFTAIGQDSTIRVRVIDHNGKGLGRMVVWVVDGKTPCVCGDSTISEKLIHCEPNIIVGEITDRNGWAHIKGESLGPNRKFKLSLDPGCVNNFPCATYGVAKDCKFLDSISKTFTANDYGGYKKTIEIVTSEYYNLHTIKKILGDSSSRFNSIKRYYQLDSGTHDHIRIDKFWEIAHNNAPENEIDSSRFGNSLPEYGSLLPARPYAKGTWSYGLDRIASYSHSDMYSAGKKTETITNYCFSPCVKYFVADHWNIGASVNLWNNKTSYIDPTATFNQTTTTFTYNAELGYVTQLSPKGLFWDAGIHVGAGSISNSAGGAGSTLPSTENLFNFGGDIGILFQPIDKGTVYVHPNFGVNYNSTSYPGYKYTGVKYDVNIGLVDYINQDQHQCGKPPLYPIKYDRGQFFMQFGTGAGFGFGTGTTTITGSATTETQKMTNNHFDLSGTGAFYFANNFAAGVRLDLGSKTMSYSGGSDKNTVFSYELGPVVQYNLPLPGALRNFYVEANYHFGESKTTATSGANSSTVKISQNGYEFGLGYNAWITRNIALTPHFEWSRDNQKDTESGITGYGTGPRISLGAKYSW
ncbi:MAG TPA: hypothetical protein VKR32_04175 [Puia sp.]|nr:hypothetical protein [Puia sp.]